MALIGLPAAWLPGAPGSASGFCELTWAKKYSCFCFCLPVSCRQFRLDLYRPHLPPRIMSKTAPLPIPRLVYQSSLHRIAMQISYCRATLGRTAEGGCPTWAALTPALSPGICARRVGGLIFFRVDQKWINRPHVAGFAATQMLRQRA